MAQQWEVEPATGRCAATGRPLEEGEEFYTVLFERDESFTRLDYSLKAWQGPPQGAYCHFKTRVPVKQTRVRPGRTLLVDNELLVGFFERLADETEPLRVQFRFVLALILMRKRLLRYEGSTIQDGVEVWKMTLTLIHRQDDRATSVVNPQLTDQQIEAVSRELSVILHSDMGPLKEGGTSKSLEV